DLTVTGVQTCALPISLVAECLIYLTSSGRTQEPESPAVLHHYRGAASVFVLRSDHDRNSGRRYRRPPGPLPGGAERSRARDLPRSEERRVGKEWRRGR